MPKHEPLRRLAACLAVAAIAACGAIAPPVDTARPPPGAFGSNGDDDVAAANLAAWAFSLSSRTHDRPIEAARSVAAVDYLAGALSSSARWLGLSPLVPQEMVQARVQVRAAVGIAPDAPSQIVVSSLAAFAAAVAEGGDPAAAAQDLANPAFTLAPQATIARLENLPFLAQTNVATQHAAAAIGGGFGARSDGAR